MAGLHAGRRRLTWRRATRQDLPLAALWAAGAAMALAGARWLPLLAPLAPRCLLHELTGVPCPSCGSTRAALALAAGDLPTAVAANPLAAAVMVLALAGGLAALPWVVLGGWVPRSADRLSLRARAGAIALLALDWAYLVTVGA